MNGQNDRKQAGVVLVLVILMLTLFEVVGVVFATFSTPQRQCEQNPTVDGRDDGCVKEVGTPTGR